MHFVCSKCKEITERKVESIKNLCNEVETANGFCYLRDRLNASGGCKAAVTGRGRIGQVRFRKCRELLFGKRFSLKIKGKVYRCSIRSAILYGCPNSKQVERWSASNCRRNWVNLAISANGTTLDKN